MTIKIPKKFKGIPKKVREFKIEKTILKKKITVKKNGVELSAVINENEMEIVGIGPAPKYFKFKNRKNKKTIEKWANVLECMQKLVDIIKNGEIDKEDKDEQIERTAERILKPYKHRG